MRSPPGDLPNPGIKPRPPTLQADSLPSESPGKHMNTGVGSLSLLQRIFPTQESNWGLLHCMQILYQLSYQGSPVKGIVTMLNWVFRSLHLTFFPLWHEGNMESLINNCQKMSCHLTRSRNINRILPGTWGSSSHDLQWLLSFLCKGNYHLDSQIDDFLQSFIKTECTP